MNKILLVEDDAQMVRLYTAKLDKEGFEVEVAKNGIEGLDKALNGNIDLILLDIMMPEMDGEEMLKKLKQSEIGQKIPVIILTNMTYLQDSKTKELANEYVLKAGTNVDDIIIKIKEHIKNNE
jgi:DNA-binding response OmpR family regulator